MEWKSWSSLPLKQREQLPPQPGIYVVVDAEQEVWYVGRSININARWNGRGHHRYPQLSRTNNQRLFDTLRSEDTLDSNFNLDTCSGFPQAE